MSWALKIRFYFSNCGSRLRPPHIEVLSHNNLSLAGIVRLDREKQGSLELPLKPAMKAGRQTVSSCLASEISSRKSQIQSRNFREMFFREGTKRVRVTRARLSANLRTDSLPYKANQFSKTEIFYLRSFQFLATRKQSDLPLLSSIPRLEDLKSKDLRKNSPSSHPPRYLSHPETHRQTPITIPAFDNTRVPEPHRYRIFPRGSQGWAEPNPRSALATRDQAHPG